MTTSAPVIDSELDLLFKQSNAAILKEVKAEEIISQLYKKPETVSIESAAVKEDASEENKEKGISRKERKEILSDSQEKQERTLFLGNLPVSCATDKIMIKALKARFTPYGEVESIRFRSIPFAEPQARRVAFIKKNFRKDGYGGTCNGYVVMKTREATLAALKENATIFNERHLRVDLALEGEGSTKTNTKKSIFIGNLAMELEEEPVWQLFGKCGSVTNVRLIRDKVTNMGKGIGYVTFSSKDSVDVALKLSGTMLGGRPIRVSPCSKLGMVEKKKARATSLADKRQKRAAALVKANPSTGSSTTLGAAKSSSTDNTAQLAAETSAAKKVSKKEAKLQTELQTKFGQLFHKKFPFAEAISEVEKNNESKKKTESSKHVEKTTSKHVEKKTSKFNENKHSKTSKFNEHKTSKFNDNKTSKFNDNKTSKYVEKPKEKNPEKSSISKPTKIITPIVRAARVEKSKSKSDFKKSSKKQ